MADQWYYVQGKESVGPVNSKKVIDLFFSERLNKQSYLWKKGLENWTKFCDIDELQDHITKPDEKDWANEDLNLVKYYVITNEVDGGDSNIYGNYSLNFIKKLFQEDRLSDQSYITSCLDKVWFPLTELEFVTVSDTDKNLKEKKGPPSPIWGSIEIESKNYIGICRDITNEGFQLLRRGLPLICGEKLSITLNIPEMNFKIRILGTVSRLLTSEQGIFVRTDQALPNQIVNHVKKTQLY